jgi:hypothetical protein
MRYLGLFIFLMVLVSSCKKEPLPVLPEDTNPFYSIKGYIDGEFVDMNVGQEGIHISQGIDEMNGVPTYFGQIISPDENLRLKIEFIRPAKPIDASGVTAFDLNNISYLVHEPACRSLGFGNNQLQANYVLIEDEEGNQLSTNQIDFTEFGIHQMKVIFNDMNQLSFTIPVQYGFKNNQVVAGFGTSANGDTTVFSAYDPELSHEWFIDGDFVSNEATFGMPMAIGIYKVEHKVTDEYQNEESFTTLIRITDYVLDWQMSFNNCSGTSQSSSNYGKVIITAIKDGVKYRSDLTSENYANSFSLNNIHYVGATSGVSPQADRVVFDFNFASTLVNESQTDSLSLSAMSGTFTAGLK